MQQQPRRAFFLMRTSVSPYFMPHVLYYRTNTHPPLNILIFMALLQQSFRFFRTLRDAFPPSENASSCENCIDRGRKIRKYVAAKVSVSKRSTQWAEKYRVHISTEGWREYLCRAALNWAARKRSRGWEKYIWLCSPLVFWSDGEHKQWWLDMVRWGQIHPNAGGNPPLGKILIHFFLLFLYLLKLTVGVQNSIIGLHIRLRWTTIYKKGDYLQLKMTQECFVANRKERTHNFG